MDQEMVNKKNFPVIASTLSPQVLADEILPDFGIAPVMECKFFTGGFNDTFRAKTMDGKTYYLRAYRPQWRTLPDIQYELGMLNHLKNKGFPAARPLVYQDGNYFCAVAAPEGERYLAVFSECPGPEVSYDHEPERVARRYGQAVMQMHNAWDDFNSPHERFHKDLAHFIDMPLHNVKPFLAHRPNDWRYFQAFAEKVREQILALPADKLEMGVCHGDLQGYHAKVDSDGMLSFYDFDCGGYGYRVYDLAVFLWCCRLEDAVENRWASFLAGYQETRLLPKLEERAIPFFVCCRYLWHMGVHTQNSPDWGIGFLNDDYFDTHLKRLREAEKDYL